MASLIRRLAGESRSITYAGTLSNPSAELAEALTSGSFGPSYTGKSVTPRNAMSLIAVYACINILASIVGSLPCELYTRRRGSSPERVTDTPLANLLGTESNPEMSAGELFELIVVHLCLHGNAYLYKARDSLGRVTALWPLLPTRVQVRRDPATQDKEFWIQSTIGGVFRGTERDVLHIRNLGVDGLVGLSPITMARQALGIYAAHEEYQGTVYRNGAQPGGVIQLPPGKKLDEPGVRELRAAWDGNHKGLPMAGRIGVLQDGQTFQELSLSMADQQFIEQQHFSIGQVCNLLNVPKWALGEATGDSLTYATVEQQSDYFATFSIALWPNRIERELHRDGDIFTDPSYYCAFNLDELKRAALLDRYNAYGVAIDKGFMGRSVAAARENLPAPTGVPEFGPIPDPTKTTAR